MLLPAAAQLKPYRQGDGSSLCGLYGILNGIQLVLWPQYKLTGGQQKALFDHAVDHLENAGQLVEVIQLGIDEDPWLKLTRSVIVRANQLTGAKIRRRFILRNGSNWTSRKALAAIKQQLRMGRPVIVMLWGAYDHVSVFVGYDRQRLRLFDSSGFKWIEIPSVGLQHPASRKRHQITRATVFALTLPPHVDLLDW